MSEEIVFNCMDNILPYFKALENILKSERSSVQEKNTAWRQQSLIIKCLDEGLVDNFMERHWRLHPGFNEKFLESHNDDAYLKNIELSMDLEFPDINNMDFPIVSNLDNKMFEESSFKSNQQPRKEIKREDSTGKARNTMENFLQGNVPPVNVESNFCSARQLLAVQTLKLQTDGLQKQQYNLNNLQKSDVGFNFAATKKSLGCFGRVINSSRKNFVSPVRNNVTVDTNSNSEENMTTEMDLKLSHPVLKNVDPKMVELINNEIIHKFRPIEWHEIAGLDYAKSVIKEAVVYPLLRPDIFTGLRRPPRGILLFGPPGTGKTLIGKCIASQSSATFFSISSSSLTSKWMGEGEKMVRALFAVAVARQPSVIFIDEVDSLLAQRSENENEGTRRLKTEFLVRLDGAATSDDDRVLIVGATNRPQELDEAVRRRFVKRLYVPLPEVNARAEILKNLLKTVENNLDSNQIKEISQMAEGYSGADMDSLCREASMEPLRSLPADSIITFHKENLRHVNVDDFYSALKKIRPSVSQNDLNQYVEWNEMYGSSS